MSISGQEAAQVLARLSHRVDGPVKDNTDKFWAYKIKSAKRTEFAFDPKTKNGLYVRTDREIPSISGISDIEKIAGKDVSTALGRVFSGGMHKAAFKASIASESALLALIEHYESL